MLLIYLNWITYGKKRKENEEKWWDSGRTYLKHSSVVSCCFMYQDVCVLVAFFAFSFFNFLYNLFHNLKKKKKYIRLFIN